MLHLVDGGLDVLCCCELGHDLLVDLGASRDPVLHDDVAGYPVCLELQDGLDILQVDARLDVGAEYLRGSVAGTYGCQQVLVVLFDEHVLDGTEDTVGLVGGDHVVGYDDVDLLRECGQDVLDRSEGEHLVQIVH